MTGEPSPSWTCRAFWAVLAAVTVSCTAPAVGWMFFSMKSVPSMLAISLVSGLLAAIAGAIWPPGGNRTSWIERVAGAGSGLFLGPISWVVITMAAGLHVVQLGAIGHAAIAGMILGALVPRPFIFLFTLIPVP